MSITELEAAAIAFVEAVARTQVEHPEWSDIENGLDAKEIPKWRRLKRAVKVRQHG